MASNKSKVQDEKPRVDPLKVTVNKHGAAVYAPGMHPRNLRKQAEAAKLALAEQERNAQPEEAESDEA